MVRSQQRRWWVRRRCCHHQPKAGAPGKGWRPFGASAAPPAARALARAAAGDAAIAALAFSPRLAAHALALAAVPDDDDGGATIVVGGAAAGERGCRVAVGPEGPVAVVADAGPVAGE